MTYRDSISLVLRHLSTRATVTKKPPLKMLTIYRKKKKLFLWAGIAQSVQESTMGWAVQRPNPGAGKIFCTHPALYTMGTRSSPGVKQLWHGINHPPPPTAKVKERVVLYIYSPSGPSWSVLGWTLLYSFFWNIRTCFCTRLQQYKLHEYKSSM